MVRQKAFPLAYFSKFMKVNFGFSRVQTNPFSPWKNDEFSRFLRHSCARGKTIVWLSIIFHRALSPFEALVFFIIVIIAVPKSCRHCIFLFFIPLLSRHNNIEERKFFFKVTPPLIQPLSQHFHSISFPIVIHHFFQSHFSVIAHITGRRDYEKKHNIIFSNCALSLFCAGNLLVYFVVVLVSFFFYCAHRKYD